MARPYRSRVNRREFSRALAAIALVPLPAAAAQRAGRVYRVGLFHVGLDHLPPSLTPLRAALKTLGYEEQGNLRFDWRNLGDARAARDTTRDFVAQPVDVIVAFENVSARAAKAATTTIPVVFVHVTDPVRDGFAVFRGSDARGERAEPALLRAPERMGRQRRVDLVLPGSRGGGSSRRWLRRQDPQGRQARPACPSRSSRSTSW